MRATLPLSALALAALTTPAFAQLRVGPGEAYETIAAAAAAAQDGDTVEIVAGTYHEEVVWSADRLTIRGVGGRPVIDMTGRALTRQGGKGIFILDGADITLENVELVGASVPDGNGAGIRWQGAGHLVVRGCVLRDNEDGILGGNHADDTALIEGNEFVGNGRGDVGYTHNVYINGIDTLTFQGNWSHALASGLGDSGHLLKTRARNNFVLYNRLTAEGGPSSYELQLPQGGTAYVIGNLIEQGTSSNNATVISIGGDGTQWPEQRVFLSHNTVVNRLGRGTFISATAPVELGVVNNLFIGQGALISGGVVTREQGNLTPDLSVLVDGAGYDWRPVPGSAPVDMGSAPGSDGAVSLVPTLEYRHPMALAPRAVDGALDVGALELVAALPDAGPPEDAGQDVDAGSGPEDAGEVADAGDAGAPADGGVAVDAGQLADAGSVPQPDSSGCSCRGARDTSGAALGVLVLWFVARRRR